MNEVFWVILCGTLRIGPTVTDINALITPLTEMETCPPYVRSHWIVYFNLSWSLFSKFFLPPDVEDCGYSAKIHSLLLPFPMTMSMDWHSRQCSFGYPCHLLPVSKRWNSIKSILQNRYNFWIVSFPELCCFNLITWSQTETKIEAAVVVLSQ